MKDGMQEGERRLSGTPSTPSGDFLPLRGVIGWLEKAH
jgi:hypothetical protein